MASLPTVEELGREVDDDADDGPSIEQIEAILRSVSALKGITLRSIDPT